MKLTDASEATCLLVSQIGRSISNPQITEVNVRTTNPVLERNLKIHIREIVQDHLDRIHTLSEELVAGQLALDRWPFRQPSPCLDIPQL